MGIANKEKTRVAITMYGIRSCDTVKRARAWLEGRGIDYRFHDYKAAGVDLDRLRNWCEQVGWETLVNRSGTTFRKLPEREKQLLSEEQAMRLMLAQPSLIRRPVLEAGRSLVVGFVPGAYEELLGATR